MQRRAFITFLCAALVASASAAFATTYADDIVAQLGKQGFTDVTTETTWLGRLRILASRKDGQREIVINPRTGEVLRDQWTRANASASAQPILDDVGEGQDHNGSGGSLDGGGDDTGSGGSGTDGSGSGGSGEDGHDGNGGDDSSPDDGGSDHGGDGN